MKLNIYNKEGKSVGTVELNLDGNIREDIFKKIVLIERSWFRQPYGASPMAGKKNSVELSRRRRKYRGSYGRGISRIPRKVMWRRGTQFRFVGAFAPGTVGGRKAHPPKSWKNLTKNVNFKEWILGVKIGVIASLNKDVISNNGQRVPKVYPIVLDESVNELKKTKEFLDLLNKFGFEEELNRISKIKVRAGRGKLRNRRYIIKRGPLIVVSDEDDNLVKIANNIKGVEIVHIDFLLAKDFGMDINPGRIVLFTKNSLEQLKEELM